MTQKAHIAKEFRLEAAHFLPNHGGKCRNLHGHSYRVVVELAGTPLPAGDGPSEGMVRDFADVSAAWLSLHRRLDHQLLNDVVPEDYLPTTAEHLAAFVLDELAEALPELVAVTIWETASSWARVERQA